MQEHDHQAHAVRDQLDHFGAGYLIGYAAAWLAEQAGQARYRLLERGRERRRELEREREYLGLAERERDDARAQRGRARALLERRLVLECHRPYAEGWRIVPVTLLDAPLYLVAEQRGALVDRLDLLGEEGCFYRLEVRDA